MLDVDEIPERPNINTLASFWAGFVGGIAGLAVGHPFVKVRLQSRELASRYKGTWHCFAMIIKQEKVFGLYKGMASPAVGVAGANALVFGSYTFLIEKQAELRGRPISETDLPPLLDVFIAGMGAGTITSIMTCPMELAKVQLQNQTTTGDAMKYRGPIDCITKLYYAGGIRQCFKGMGSTVLRELSFGPYFLCYESICRGLTPKGSTMSHHEITGPKVILAGGAAGIVSWCSTYPADVIKTRIQSEPNRYKGFVDCLRHCYREEGYRILFRGLTPTILRAFPSNAATFMGYTWTMRLFTAEKPFYQREEVAI
ncbi:hypothetical protein PHYBLDRAFT_138474 [Phycomyces blakesleeanus NRRL 1555(-)]|uniref:Mitochondrial carrier protein n=1 Tax=Phycomyces blakesleeanus (strain ATCC 8743b / DSM 1359 / FGSC 10004 / NBRC 33097 / NRRL 1555) TaxID=763407 RepID=A0A163BDS7_PHYB8|nr:hypothetical protein PHYBLDRAFT_138474 [Phycomyces blakesleeanus NRRL 1555(-)]OAD80921.1 hypothetical protein PHYBLDRAFT_138474 [Phycomyces blakesleeanus NRRL 1555(-)]|eukprot:XP_018298961.1 hypothetical protein PHYBLDRAFT_138474 [Phycomyces blakesleeanus NRRL 1555(-)]